MKISSQAQRIANLNQTPVAVPSHPGPDGVPVVSGIAFATGTPVSPGLPAPVPISTGISISAPPKVLPPPPSAMQIRQGYRLFQTSPNYNNLRAAAPSFKNAQDWYAWMKNIGLVHLP